MKKLKVLHRLLEIYKVQILIGTAFLGLLGILIGCISIIASLPAEAEKEVVVEPQLVWVEVQKAKEHYDIAEEPIVKEKIAPLYCIEEDEPFNVPILAEIPLSKEMQEYVWYTAGRFGLDPYLVFAVMYVESGFDPNAVSVTNDYGLMQVNACNHGWLSAKYGITNFLDPYQNTTGGCDILSESLGRCGNTRTGLMSYNLGYGGASALWSQGVYTSDYAEKVIGMYEYYKQIAGY